MSRGRRGARLRDRVRGPRRRPRSAVAPRPRVRAAQLHLVGGPEPQRLAELDVSPRRGDRARGRGPRPAPTGSSGPPPRRARSCDLRRRGVRPLDPGQHESAPGRDRGGRPGGQSADRHGEDTTTAPVPCQCGARCDRRTAHRRRPHRSARRAASISAPRSLLPLCPRTRRGRSFYLSVAVPRTAKPPGTGAALTPCTLMRGSENTVIVARPPKGTSGATTSLPSCAETVASTVALRPSRVAVPRRVRRPSEEATGVSEVRNGAAARRSDSATTRCRSGGCPA